jgi:hypothetical protein
MAYPSLGRERLKQTRSRIRALPSAPDTIDIEVLHAPSDEDKKLLADITAEIRKRQVSSSENFDKSVLTLSSGGLAVSLGFLKDFVPVAQSLWPLTLYLSWIGLTAATVVTMLSFLASARAQEYQQATAEAYYLRRDESRINRNPWDRVVTWMNRTSGASFILGVILTTLFVAINLQRAQDMKKERLSISHEGMTSPAVQRISNAGDLRRGLPSPAITPSTSRPSSAPAPAPTSTPNTAPVKK